MADITMCTNNLCPKARMCKRVCSKPSEYFQSYASFEYSVSSNNVVCDYFYPYHTAIITNKTVG